jgi:hypothetical protein
MNEAQIVNSDHWRAAIHERREILRVQDIDPLARRRSTERPAQAGQPLALGDPNGQGTAARRQRAVKRMVAISLEQREVVVPARGE